MSENRLEYLDYAKGVAIICVVLGHVLQFDFYSNVYLNHSWLSSFVCSFHNSLFMFVSGSVSVTFIEKSRIVSDIIKRFRSLLIPAFVVGIPYTVWLSGDVLLFFTNSWKMGYWYLFSLFLLYLLFYPVALCRSKHIKWFYLVSIPIWVEVYRHMYWIPQNIRDLFCLDMTCNMFPYFLLGNAVKRFHLCDYLFQSKWIFFITLFIWIFAIPLNRVFGLYMISYVTTAATVLCIMNICHYCGKLDHNNRILCSLSFIGKNTLYIYLFHYFVVQLLIFPSVHEWFAQNGNIAIDIVACIIPTTICICFSIAVLYLMRKKRFIMKFVFNK